MATAVQSVGRVANPLWPFRSPQDRIISSCDTKPSGATLRTALQRAYQAGKRIGSNDIDYANWLCKSGLAQRSATVRARLKKEYERGMAEADGKAESTAPEAGSGIQEEVLSGLINLGAKSASAKKAVAQAVKEGLTDFDAMFRRAVEIARVRNPDYYAVGYAAGQRDAGIGKRRPYKELTLLAPEGPAFEELHQGYLHGNWNEYYRLHPKYGWRPLTKADNPEKKIGWVPPISPRAEGERLWDEQYARYKLLKELLEQGVTHVGIGSGTRYSWQTTKPHVVPIGKLMYETRFKAGGVVGFDRRQAAEAESNPEGQWTVVVSDKVRIRGRKESEPFERNLSVRAGSAKEARRNVIASGVSAKRIVRVVEGNPGSEIGAQAVLVEEKRPGWGPTFDISHWTRAARRAAEDVRDAQIYEPRDGQTLVEFPKDIRTSNAAEDLEEVRCAEEGNPNPGSEIGAAAQVAAERARGLPAGITGSCVEVEHPDGKLFLRIYRHTVSGRLVKMYMAYLHRHGPFAWERRKVVSGGSLEGVIQRFLETGGLG